jgi:hypothetical protein
MEQSHDFVPQAPDVLTRGIEVHPPTSLEHPATVGKSVTNDGSGLRLRRHLHHHCHLHYYYFDQHCH